MKQLRGSATPMQAVQAGHLQALWWHGQRSVRTHSLQTQPSAVLSWYLLLRQLEQAARLAMLLQICGCSSACQFRLSITSWLASSSPPWGCRHTLYRCHRSGATCPSKASVGFALVAAVKLVKRSRHRDGQLGLCRFGFGHYSSSPFRYARQAVAAQF